MPKRSIIETIAMERKKKKRKRRKAQMNKKLDKNSKISDLQRKKHELETMIQAEQARLGRAGAKDKKFTLDSGFIDSGLKAGSGQGEPGFMDQLIENGTKEGWAAFIGYNLKNKLKMEFPPLDQEKFKFGDYGYRRLVELLFESPELVQIIIEVKDVSGFQMVSLKSLFRGDEPTMRGIEALCGLIQVKTRRYDPVCETDFKYLNIILDSFTISKKENSTKIWDIKTEKKEVKITANFDKGNREWVYKID